MNTHIRKHPVPESIGERIVTSRAVVAEIFLEPVEQGFGYGHDHASEAHQDSKRVFRAQVAVPILDDENDSVMVDENLEAKNVGAHVQK